MPTLVTIATYEQSKTACFLKEKLENEDIDCFFAVISTNGGELGGSPGPGERRMT